MRSLAALLLILGVACNDAERQGLTADTAVMQPVDSSGGPTPAVDRMIDSGASDTLGVDSIAAVNPVVVLVADSVAGDVLFRRKGKCLSCHGLSGRGIEGLGPNLQDSVWLHGDGSFAFIRRTIMEGIARPEVAGIGMPAFAAPAGSDPSALSNTLTPEEIYHITAYVYTLSHPGSAVADTAAIAADTVAGGGVDSLAPPPVPLNTPSAERPDVGFAAFAAASNRVAVGSTAAARDARPPAKKYLVGTLVRR